MAEKKPDGRVGQLAGFTDPEVPGWEERALLAVRKRQKKTKRWTERKCGTLITYDDPFRIMLTAAAMARGISVTAYCRRAVGAFIARDLGVSFAEVMKNCAHPAGALTNSEGKWSRGNDDGKGYGPWGIEKLSGD